MGVHDAGQSGTLAPKRFRIWGWDNADLCRRNRMKLCGNQSGIGFFRRRTSLPHDQQYVAHLQQIGARSQTKIHGFEKPLFRATVGFRRVWRCSVFSIAFHGLVQFLYRENSTDLSRAICVWLSSLHANSEALSLCLAFVRLVLANCYLDPMHAGML